MVREIRKDYPFVMNITLGYYGNHSVTVVGYKTFNVYVKYNSGKTRIKNAKMLAIYDGWKPGIRYIFYNNLYLYNNLFINM